MTPARLTVYFIVQPPDYQYMACYLAASLREQFGSAVALIGYCPAEKLDAVHSDVRRVLERLNCDLRGFATAGRFDEPYPHGNKLLATLERRETEFSCFMDSDILCIRPNRIEALIREGHVSLSRAASMNWAPQSIWETIYALCGMEIPTERFKLMRQRKGVERIPYFSSGLVAFPETHRNAEGRSFPEVWMDIARTLDAAPDLPGKRPYLDQMSLPLAIRKAGLDWNILQDEQHYILGGRARGEPLPSEPPIFTVHYRQWEVLKEAGLSRQAKDMLERHAGVRRMAQISKRRSARG